MAEESRALINIACDCGEQFKVPGAGRDSDGQDVVCPACGDTSHFDAAQIASFNDQIDVAVENTVEQIGEATQDMLADIARRHKGITYRPK